MHCTSVTGSSHLCTWQCFVSNAVVCYMSLRVVISVKIVILLIFALSKTASETSCQHLLIKSYKPSHSPYPSFSITTRTSNASCSSQATPTRSLLSPTAISLSSSLRYWTSKYSRITIKTSKTKINHWNLRLTGSYTHSSAGIGYFEGKKINCDQQE
jgi:hypothetical protein